MLGFSSKKIFLLIFLLLSLGFAADATTVQYNQTDSPFVSTGGMPSGNYNDLNILGEGLTYNIPEINDTQYYLEVWHNSTQIAAGGASSINVTVNFTSNVSDFYSLQIYNWTSSQWSVCYSDNVAADSPSLWWCNRTVNSSDFNSTDRRIRVRLNTSKDDDAGLLSEDYVQYYVSYPSYLEARMTNPNTTITMNVVRNQIFNINTTATCKKGPCGEVFGRILYNLSSPVPDTPVNTTSGEFPFYIMEASPNYTKSCGAMYSGDTCTLNWTVNATGTEYSDWKIGTVFNSSFSDITNSTQNATISITGCTLDFSLSWSSISFGSLEPSSGPNNATGNQNKTYNITVNPGSCNLDFYINATDLVNTTWNSTIGVGNISWSNSSWNYNLSYNLTKTPLPIRRNVTHGSNVTTWYWLIVPPVFAAYYSGNISIYGVINGDAFS